uniref:Uncharacterized protein n=1 Tax=Oryza brachyantha TaxID=4533 RepID=J3MWB9_ORYBR
MESVRINIETLVNGMEQSMPTSSTSHRLFHLQSEGGNQGDRPQRVRATHGGDRSFKHSSLFSATFSRRSHTKISGLYVCTYAGSGF